MSVDQQPDPSPVLRQIIVELERMFSRGGFGIQSHSTERHAEAEVLVLVVKSVATSQTATYLFGHYSGNRQVDWIAYLSQRAADARVTAGYAVSTASFSEEAEALARNERIGLHHVGPGRNRLIPYRLGGASVSGPERPPLLLTQRIDAATGDRTWKGHFLVDVDGRPALELIVTAAIDANKKLQVTQRQVPLSSIGRDTTISSATSFVPRPVHTDCFARQLGGCDQISGEHIISHSILKLLPGHDIVVSEAPPGVMGRSKKKFKWPILCRRHNNALSNVDDDAREFFATVTKALDGDAPAAKTRASVRFDGLKLERWLLKVACGLVAAAQGDKYSGDVPAEWVNVLFGELPWPSYFGSYWDARNDKDAREHAVRVLRNVDNVSARTRWIELRTMMLTVALALGSFEGVPGIQRPVTFSVGHENVGLKIEVL